jgi:bud site selection protein 31
LIRFEFARLSDILEDYAKKMRDAENDDHEGKRKVESVW